MKISEHNNPVRVNYSNDWSRSCREEMANLRINNPIVISSKGGFDRLKLGSVFEDQYILKEISLIPSFESCQDAIDRCLNHNFDGVIAIGGGSVMDTAKSVMSHLGTGLSIIEDLLKVTTRFKNRIPSIFIPTTHGTGSEVTKWGTIWNFQEKKKYSISHPDLYPDVAILDGRLTLSLPMEISLITVLDALSHSLESIWNKNKNPKSTGYAIESIGLIYENINLLKKNSQDPKVRENLLSASNIAGLAFSMTRTAAAHSISYPLTIKFDIPHGIASSITLPSLLEVNGSAIENELDAIYKQLNISGISEFKDFIYSISKNYLKFSLSEWGIQHKDLRSLVSSSFTQGRMENNIIDLDEEKVYSILNYCF
ncbi:iron-containing alcohol dehydrogenase family protein [Candidatus Marinimicrobia bacterium MT.SAG.4]|nr:iron-containing alcohol dehydrogenase family protein [Candidatus Marinimicrobia bacterium MT.SAG.4]